MNPQARRYARPNRVRHDPTNRRSVSGCSPPRVAATQLPLTTRERVSPREGTFTPQIAPAPRRADPGFRRNDVERTPIDFFTPSGEGRVGGMPSIFFSTFRFNLSQFEPLTGISIFVIIPLGSLFSPLFFAGCDPLQSRKRADHASKQMDYECFLNPSKSNKYGSGPSTRENR